MNLISKTESVLIPGEVTPINILIECYRVKVGSVKRFHLPEDANIDVIYVDGVKQRFGIDYEIEAPAMDLIFNYNLHRESILTVGKL